MPSSIWAQYDSINSTQGATAAADYLRTTIQARIQDCSRHVCQPGPRVGRRQRTFDNHDVMDILGNQTLIDWFLQARQVDPDVQRV